MAETSTRLAAIILAAGQSVRLGQPKQLITLHGIPLLRHVSEMALQVCSEVVVVLSNTTNHTPLLTDLPVTVTHNPEPEAGMGKSIACGIAHLDTTSSNCDAAMLLLADQYRITSTHLRSLIAAWETQPEQIAAAAYAEGHGPPVIFPAHWFATLQMLCKDGAKSLLGQQPLTSVPIPAAVFDLDTPSDLATLRCFENNR